MNKTASELPFDYPGQAEEFRAQFDRQVEWLRRKYGGGAHATSAIQEVFLRVLQRQRDGKKNLPRGFWRSVTRKIIDQFRRNRRHEQFLEARRVELSLRSNVTSCGTLPEEEVMKQEALAYLEDAVKELSETDRDLWERLKRDETYSQIAVATGRSADAVKMATHRLRVRLLDALPQGLRPE